MKGAPVAAAALMMAVLSGCQALLDFSVSIRESDGALDASADAASDVEAPSSDAQTALDAAANATLCGLRAREVFRDVFDDPTHSSWILATGRGYLDGGSLILTPGNDVAARMPSNEDAGAQGMRVTAHVTCQPPPNGTGAFDSVGVDWRGTQLWIWCSESRWHAYAQRPIGPILVDYEFANVTSRDEVAVTLCNGGEYEFRANGETTTGTLDLEAGAPPSQPVATLHTNGQNRQEIVEDVVVERAP